MKKFASAILLSLLVLALEFAVLPHFGFTETRLMALAAVLAGCLRGELQAMAFALFLSIPVGALHGEGFLGITIASFAVAAYFGAGAARWLYFDQFSIRLIALFVLIVAESWMASIGRSFFWPQTVIEIQWGSHALVALVGAVVYTPLLAAFGRRAGPPEPIGRRKTD